MLLARDTSLSGVPLGNIGQVDRLDSVLLGILDDNEHAKRTDHQPARMKMTNSMVRCPPS